MHTGEGPSPAPAEKHRDIPSLDGLRALSIATVILGHSKWFLPQFLVSSSLYRFTIGNSRSGVTVFFVISGYLITNLLLRELDKTGRISLSQFYFRRSMRIFPAFYFYLAVIGVLLWRHILPPMNAKSFIAAATYTWCYYPHASGTFLQHSWSLSIEEQFYLFWPVLLLFLHGRGSLVKVSVALIALMPVLRLAFYFRYPELRGLDYYLIYGWLDTMMVGCLLALLSPDQTFLKWKKRILTSRVALAMALVAFYINPVMIEMLPKPYGGFYSEVIAPFTTAACIAGVLLFVVEHPSSLAGRILNFPWIRRIGMLSYSLYLWQQLFVLSELHLLPYGYIFLVIASVTSFVLVEQPLLKLRTKLTRRVFATAH